MLWAPGPPFGKGDYGGQSPTPQCTSTPYLERQLRPLDAEGYSGAALVPYRKVEGKLELLLGFERPWNTFTNSFDTEAWSLLGGKRIWRTESYPEATAIRCFLEVTEIVESVPSVDEMTSLTSKAFVVWYPTGKYAVVFFEAAGGLLAELPNNFTEARAKAGPQEESKVTDTGVKKWVKMVDALEWVAVADLVPQSTKEVANLLRNILQVDGVRDFLTGATDPAVTLPEAVVPEGKPKAKGTSGKGGKKGGQDGWKGGKGKGDFKGGKDGKGFKGKKGGGNYFGMMQPMMAPMGYMPVSTVEQHFNDSDLQIQMYGEQLYILVQPLVGSSYIAQKITGMLLELPIHELILNFNYPEELSRRVREAEILLKQDGVI